MTTADLAMKLFAGAGSLADVTRCVYTSVEAEKLTLSEGLDIGADFAEIGFLCMGLATYTKTITGRGGHGIKISTSRIAMCFSLVYATLDVFTALESLNGWGDPNQGGDFAKGQSKFGSIDAVLAGAYPQPATWSGPGADAYARANQALQGLVERMATADAAVANIAQRQGEQVQRAHDQMAEAKAVIYGLLLFVAAVAGYSIPLLNDTEVQQAKVEGNFAAADLPSEATSAEETAAREAGRDAYLREKGYSPALTRAGLKAGAVLDEWLPLIVLPVLISTTAAVGAVYGPLIADGDSNAGDLGHQADAYQNVRRGAAAISDGSSASPAGMRTGLESRVPGFSALPVASDTAGRSQRISTVAGVGGDRGSDGAPVEARPAAGDDHWAGWFAAPASAARRVEAPLFAASGRVGSGPPNAAAAPADAPDADAGAAAGAGHAYGVPMSFAAVGPEPAPVPPWSERNL